MGDWIIYVPEMELRWSSRIPLLNNCYPIGKFRIPYFNGKKCKSLITIRIMNENTKCRTSHIAQTGTT